MNLKVLVVDDTLLYRRLISEVLGEIEGVEVVATASGGLTALTRMESLKPDLVTLDIEMPDMDGLSVMKEMQRRGLECGVVVLSAVSARGGELTIRALELGAFDFVTKPSGGTPEQNRAQLLQELGPVVRMVARRQEVRSILRGPGGTGRPAGPAAPVPAAPRPRGAAATPLPSGSSAPRPARGPGVLPPSFAAAGRSSGPAARPADSSPGLHDVTQRMQRLSRFGRPEMVLVGISTGGPNALTRMLPKLPANLDVPVLIVQHMPPIFTRSLAESLAPRCRLRVKEAETGETAVAGTIYIAPGGRQMKVAPGGRGEPVIEITDDPPENNCRPSVDYLFRSVATSFRSRAVGVVMTGMGNDGTAGLKLLKGGGALTIAQDEGSCVVYGMPREAVNAGVVDLVLSLDEIADGITRAVKGIAA